MIVSQYLFLQGDNWFLSAISGFSRFSGFGCCVFSRATRLLMSSWIRPYVNIPIHQCSGWVMPGGLNVER
jgi:hypothetical protein